MSARGFVIAAPSSGAGKTTVTLGLLRALKRRGVDVRAAKSGPDYIDPAFHEAACGAPSVNLDAWAMSPDTLRARAAAQGGALLVVEAAMGVLDAGRDGRGSAADLAAALGLPLVLVLDIAKTGQSALLPAVGLQALHPELPLAGVILNRAGTDAHGEMAATPLRDADIAVFGALRREDGLHLPERHLGLVQASETTELESFLEGAADRVDAALDLVAIVDAAGALAASTGDAVRLPPPGNRVAVARDAAFAFTYPHLLNDWHAQGAQVVPFSPLDNKGPDPFADAVFLPGGYPELHAGRLAAASKFLTLTRRAADRGARVYGECGGFMVLGEALIDAQGERHGMLGLLPLTTSFAERRLSLGYRRLAPLPGAPWDGPVMGHEFHYATIVEEGPAERLFRATDAKGTTLPEMGLQAGRVCGSFAHVIGPG
ncbi:cobyrinate a,c-diamide synthase [Tropicimonas isoalkanivorans]|uniref:Hydrogenobyrinate a,c-diamide synthase n=1 Tax=Tropicimonas isoalkanivorans TaxID=441112 RepID=A0A1I1LCW2_9RHOB|nr:cobyrinate a,c-diamide synthase [Tropicimonas isoalkanivorans]SFC70861.1 cobyrinic acid a,c-diamide synthase [Tropicimonas isoalkanivorans]